MDDETKAEFDARNKILKENPVKYIEMVTAKIDDSPRDPKWYFARHQAWYRIGEFEKAINDLGVSISLRPHYVNYLCRGRVVSQLGRYREALQDYDAAEVLAGDLKWVNCWGPLYQ